MIMNRIILAAAALLLLAGSSEASNDLKWRKIVVDGSRTGVVAASADDVDGTIGRMKGKTYIAPNGRVFKKNSATAKAGKLMIEAQASMAHVKEVVGYSTRAMVRQSPEGALSDWFVDHLMIGVERETGRKVDIGITNHGGIRADMPEGQVLYEDIQSMFPFNNTLCYVSLKGEDVIRLFEHMASHSVQAVGGVKLVVNNRQLESLLVGGEPVDPEKVYAVATISFLLEGGDGLSVGKNALEIIDTQVNIFDSLIAQIREMKARGENIEYEMDGRVTVIGGGRRPPEGNMPPPPGGPMPGGPGSDRNIGR